MTVGAQTFVLASAQDAVRLKRECVLAARRGGAMVAVRSATGDEVEVLISPGLPVLFDTVELQAYVDGEDGSTESSFEWEYTSTP